MCFESYKFILSLKVALNSTTFLAMFLQHNRQQERLTIPFLTCFANTHWISIVLCQAGRIVYARIVRQLTGTETLMAEVTSIKWRTNAYKLSLLNRFITGGSIQAWFRVTFIYIFTAVWPCPPCCTRASENKQKKGQHGRKMKINNLVQSIPTISI